MENVRGKNTKRKHLSKNKKKSWRKIDTGDVDNFLEDERLQERTGGKASEKSDESLFFIDKVVKEPNKKTDGVSLRKRRAQKSLTKYEETLQPPPPAKKDKRASDTIAKLDCRKRKLDNHVAKRKIRQRPEGRYKTDYDLWGDDSSQKEEDPHYMMVTKRLRIQPPKHAALKPSKLPALDVPHPGASYNPAFDDHQDLLLKAHQVELKKIEQEEKIRRALDDKFPTERPTEASRLKEMSSGLFDDESDDEGSDEDDSDDDDEGDLDRLSVNPPVRRENKKNERQRKKEQKRKEEDKKKQEEKIRRVKDNNVFRLKGIKRELGEKEKLIADKIQKKAENDIVNGPFQTKRLGKQRFIEPDMDLKLSDELVGSLRELKPEGCLLEDKFQNLQKRNIIETRNKTKKKRKLKLKQFEKKSHREVTFKEITG